MQNKRTVLAVWAVLVIAIALGCGGSSMVETAPKATLIPVRTLKPKWRSREQLTQQHLEPQPVFLVDPPPYQNED